MLIIFSCFIPQNYVYSILILFINIYIVSSFFIIMENTSVNIIITGMGKSRSTVYM